MSTEFVYCEACGTKLIASAQFCRACGRCQPSGYSAPVAAAVAEWPRVTERPRVAVRPEAERAIAAGHAPARARDHTSATVPRNPAVPAVARLAPIPPRTRVAPAA